MPLCMTHVLSAKMWSEDVWILAASRTFGKQNVFLEFSSTGMIPDYLEPVAAFASYTFVHRVNLSSAPLPENCWNLCRDFSDQSVVVLVLSSHGSLTPSYP